jgi:hypothetical protein
MRNLVVLGQNETGRASTDHENTYLSTIGLHGCVAVIFYSEETGRISLTHADTKTDHAFLSEELKWVGEENCMVFLIKNRGDLATLIRMALMQRGVSKITEHTSEQGTVVFNHKKGVPQFFAQSDFLELVSHIKESNPENKLRRLNYQPSYMNNPFVAQVHTYARQLNAVVSTVCSHHPILAFDVLNWCKYELELASDVLSKIQAKKFSQSTLEIVEYVWPRYQKLISQMAIAAARGVELTPIVESTVATKRI